MLFLLAISSIFLLGSSVKGGKVDLFLVDPFIVGDPVVAEQTDRLVNSVSQMTSASHRVLYGHYSKLLERRKKMGSPLPSSSLRGRTLINKATPDFSSRSVSQVLDIFKDNYVHIIKGAIKSTTSSLSDVFVSQFETCKGVLDVCNYLPGILTRCGVHCLGRANSHLDGLTDMVEVSVENFCSPLESIFEKLLTYTGANFRQFRRFDLYVTGLKESRKDILDLGKLAAEALLPTLVSYVRTDLMPLRRMLASLIKSITSFDAQYISAADVTSNRICLEMNDLPAAAQLVNSVLDNQVILDVLMQGYSLLASVSKYLPGFNEFTALVEVVRMNTGRICGLLAFAQSGHNDYCDQLGGYPTVGFPLPDIPGIPEANPECMPDATTRFGPGSEDSSRKRRKRSVGMMSGVQNIQKVIAESMKVSGGNKDLPSTNLRKRRTLFMGRK